MTREERARPVRRTWRAGDTRTVSLGGPPVRILAPDWEGFIGSEGEVWRLALEAVEPSTDPGAALGQRILKADITLRIGDAAHVVTVDVGQVFEVFAASMAVDIRWPAGSVAAGTLTTWDVAASITRGTGHGARPVFSVETQNNLSGSYAVPNFARRVQFVALTDPTEYTNIAAEWRTGTKASGGTVLARAWPDQGLWLDVPRSDARYISVDTWPTSGGAKTLPKTILWELGLA